MTIDLSIIIPVLNNSRFTKNALNDLAKLPKNHEIIVVDNGSTDDTADVLMQASSRYSGNGQKFSVIFLNENRGFGAANNQGYNLSIGTNVLFLNNDIYVKSSYRTWTQNIIRQTTKGYLVAAQAGLLNNEFNFVKEGKDIDLNNPLSYLSGWCLGGSRKRFDELKLKNQKGPWNERYFLYFEDDDLSWRARQNNIKMKLVNVPVHHFGRMTGRLLNMQKYFIESREKFITDWKNILNEK